MAITLAVDGSIFASLLFTHLHVAMASDVCPPAGETLPSGTWPAAVVLLMLMSSWLAHRARAHSLQGSMHTLYWHVVALAVVFSLGFTLDLVGHARASLSPTAQAWSASVAALLAWQGFHLLLVLLTTVYVLARAQQKLLQPWARATLDNAVLLWHYAAWQGIAAPLLVHTLPRLL